MKQPRLGERLHDFPKVPRRETVGSRATVDSRTLGPPSKAFSTVLDAVVAEREISNEEDDLGEVGAPRLKKHGIATQMLR